MSPNNNRSESGNEEPKDIIEQLENDNNLEIKLSKKQTKFLDLINPNSILPTDWGISDKPTISYFGIASESGILAFNQNGQEFIHDAMSDDSIENIRQSGQVWENFLEEKIFEIESAKSRSNIEERQKSALDLVVAEKAKLDILKAEISAEREAKKTILARRSKLRPDYLSVKEKIRVIYLAKKNGQSYDEDELRELEKLKQAKAIEIGQINNELKPIIEDISNKKNNSFREFALRRGWYRDDSTFRYLDERRGKYGVVYKPEFANNISPNEYNQWLKDLFYANKYALSPESTLYDESEEDPATRRNTNDMHDGKSVKQLVEEMIQKIDHDVGPDIEQINKDIKDYILVEKNYLEGRNYWWNGHFATEIRKDEENRHSFIRFNEVTRVKRFYANMLESQVAIDQQKASDVVIDYKKQLGKNLFGGDEAGELFILPTGVIAFSGDKKMLKPMPVTDEAYVGISAGITKDIWDRSWLEYIHKNINKDSLKLAKNANRKINLDSPTDRIKDICESHGVSYDDNLINEETGEYLPYIDSSDQDLLAGIVDKCGSFIGSIKYTDAEQRYKQKIGYWRRVIEKSVLSTNTVTPLFVRDAFAVDENGLSINFNKVPDDASDDIEAFGLAIRYAAWTNLSEESRKEYFNLLGPRLDIQQKLFVETFRGFVYNKSTYRELVARAFFFDQFVKWQNGKLDGEEKQFFEQLANKFKRK